MTLKNMSALVHGLTDKKEIRKKQLGVSAVLGMIIGLGITAAVGGGVYFAFQEQADVFTTSSQIEVKNLSAIRSSDTLTITGNIKNVGSTSITSIAINEISSGDDFRLFDTNKNDCLLNTNIGTKSLNAGAVGCDTGASGFTPLTSTDYDGATNPVIEIATGFTTAPGGPDGNSAGDASIDGGSSKAFQLRIKANSTTTGEISDNVRISDRLTFQLFYESGQDEFVSEIYNTRVRSG